MGKNLIKCKTCGADIAKDAKTCPSCGAKNKRKHPVLGVLLILVGIAAVASALGGGDPAPSRVDATAASTSQTDGGSSLASSAVSAPSTAEASTQTTFGVGETVELNDVVVTLVDVSENDGGNYMSPTDGKEFVVFEFEIENNSSSEITVSSLLSFDAYVDDYATALSLSATISTGKSQLDGAVAAGKKMNGVIGYEVDPGWSEMEVHFTPSFWTSKDIVFVAAK